MTKFINALLNIPFLPSGMKDGGEWTLRLQFATNQFRNFVCLVVEVMPPEAINRAIAL